MRLFKLCLLSLVLASAAYAKDSAHIITGSTSSSVSASQPEWSDSYDIDFSATLGYDYAFTGGFQLGGTAGVGIFSGGSSGTLTIGPGYNFSPDDIENSFFTTIRFGVSNLHIDSETSVTDTFISAEFAKRFKVIENVSYVPGLLVTKELGPDAADPTFNFDIFRLSLVF